MELPASRLAAAAGASADGHRQRLLGWHTTACRIWLGDEWGNEWGDEWGDECSQRRDGAEWAGAEWIEWAGAQLLSRGAATHREPLRF